MISISLNFVSSRNILYFYFKSIVTYMLQITVQTKNLFIMVWHKNASKWLRRGELGAKLYIPSTLNFDLILWHIQLIVWAENVKSWFKSWVFKLIFCPIQWIVCLLAYLNFIFEFWSSFSAAQNGRLCPGT